jgi:hypothetical protein
VGAYTGKIRSPLENIIGNLTETFPKVFQTCARIMPSEIGKFKFLETSIFTFSWLGSAMLPLYIKYYQAIYPAIRALILRIESILDSPETATFPKEEKIAVLTQLRKFPPLCDEFLDFFPPLINKTHLVRYRTDIHAYAAFFNQTIPCKEQLTEVANFCEKFTDDTIGIIKPFIDTNTLVNRLAHYEGGPARLILSRYLQCPSADFLKAASEFSMLAQIQNIIQKFIPALKQLEMTGLYVLVNTAQKLVKEYIPPDPANHKALAL